MIDPNWDAANRATFHHDLRQRRRLGDGEAHLDHIAPERLDHRVRQRHEQARRHIPHHPTDRLYTDIAA
ncbi:hypothetical protein [uncultured Sphingomonas sp.]|uniref:hypothetical protein n=1 Tax=uncultured Sphingomonas sp. TaxID=158754 RepID=UPI0030F73728